MCRVCPRDLSCRCCCRSCSSRSEFITRTIRSRSIRLCIPPARLCAACSRPERQATSASSLHWQHLAPTLGCKSPKRRFDSPLAPPSKEKLLFDAAGGRTYNFRTVPSADFTHSYAIAEPCTAASRYVRTTKESNIHG